MICPKCGVRYSEFPGSMINFIRKLRGRLINKILLSDCLDVMKKMPTDSIDEMVIDIFKRRER